MAIFDFIKTAGRKLFEHMGSDADQKNADTLQQHLEKLGLGLKNAVVQMQGDKVSVEGTANSQDDLEKAVLALGNIEGVGQVESRIAAPDAKQQPEFYTVKSGDTLSKIAKQYYGNANAYMRIFEANTPLLKNPDDIFPGQKLRIPPKEAKAA